MELDDLIRKYGPLITIAKAAEILDRSVGGFRSSLSRCNDPVCIQLREITVSVGRRKYFPTDQFFEVVLNSQSVNH